jgi:hypothetical protein
MQPTLEPDKMALYECSCSTSYRSTISGDIVEALVSPYHVGPSDDLHPYGHHYTTIGLDVSPVGLPRRA